MSVEKERIAEAMIIMLLAEIAKEVETSKHNVCFHCVDSRVPHPFNLTSWLDVTVKLFGAIPTPEELAMEAYRLIALYSSGTIEINIHQNCGYLKEFREAYKVLKKLSSEGKIGLENEKLVIKGEVEGVEDKKAFIEFVESLIKKHLLEIYRDKEGNVLVSSFIESVDREASNKPWEKVFAGYFKMVALPRIIDDAVKFAKQKWGEKTANEINGVLFNNVVVKYQPLDKAAPSTPIL